MTKLILAAIGTILVVLGAYILLHGLLQSVSDAIRLGGSSIGGGVVFTAIATYVGVRNELDR
jgi:hypothetical protein